MGKTGRHPRVLARHTTAVMLTQIRVREYIGAQRLSSLVADARYAARDTLLVYG